MNYASSRSVRRIVGRLAKGEPFVQSLERLCKRERVRAGAFQAIGLLRGVELQTYSDATGYQTHLKGESTFEALSLSGNISTLGDQVVLNCYAHLGTHSLGQWQTFGGRLAEAEALSVEFVVEVFDDLVLERRLDARAKLPLWNRIERRDVEVFADDVPAQASPNPEPAPIEPPAPKPEPARPAPPEPVVAQSPPPAPKPEPAPVAPKPEPAAPKPEPKPEPAPVAPKPEPPPAKAAAFSSDGAVVTRATPPPTIVRRTSPTPVPTTSPAEDRAAKRAKKKKASASSWDDAVQTSQSVSSSRALGIDKRQAEKMAIVEDWPDMPELNVNDLVQHPHFGLCRILYVEEDDYIRVKMQSGKVVDIKLEVCELTYAGEKHGKPIYDCKIVT